MGKFEQRGAELYLKPLVSRQSAVAEAAPRCERQNRYKQAETEVLPTAGDAAQLHFVTGVSIMQALHDP